MPSRVGVVGAVAIAWLASSQLGAAVTGQATPVRPPVGAADASPAAVQKVGETSYRIGRLLVDTSRREVTAPGTVNDVTLLEFVANTRDGLKAYESAITIDCDAISFNAALLLVGLDPARAVVPQVQFDRSEPKGDPVDIAVSWTDAGRERRVRVEELLLDQRSGKTVAEGPWVYTGSSFIGTGPDRRFRAELDGVLIGLMHGPAALIENPRADAVDGYGFVVLNPKLGLPAGSAVTVTLRALAP